jgi:hypothetical protein
MHQVIGRFIELSICWSGTARCKRANGRCGRQVRDYYTQPCHRSAFVEQIIPFSKAGDNFLDPFVWQLTSGTPHSEAL